RKPKLHKFGLRIELSQRTAAPGRLEWSRVRNIRWGKTHCDGAEIAEPAFLIGKALSESRHAEGGADPDRKKDRHVAGSGSFEEEFLRTDKRNETGCPFKELRSCHRPGL